MKLLRRLVWLPRIAPPSRVALAYVFAATVCALGASQDPPLVVGVRSTVVMKPAKRADKSGLGEAPEHDRVYAILSVQMFPSEEELVEPVDAHALLDEVCLELNRHGFRQVEKGHKPEILLTVQYGRAWLNNPYLSETRDSQTVIGTSSIATTDGNATALLNTANRNVTGSWAPLMSRMAPGAEASLQEAQFEKLCIRLIAWRYFSDPKARAQQLWRTTMLLDDPDHRDLNAFASEMLAAGAPYFGRDIAEPETKVVKPPPEGQVNVGTPVEVDPPAPKAGTVPALTRPASARVVQAPIRQYDVASGDAVAALQAFSRQSGEEIIYPVEQVRAVKTNRVRGELTARAALEQMLDGTGLMAVVDEKTGALAVRPASRPAKDL